MSKDESNFVIHLLNVDHKRRKNSISNNVLRKLCHQPFTRNYEAMLVCIYVELVSFTIRFQLNVDAQESWYMQSFCAL